MRNHLIEVHGVEAGPPPAKRTRRIWDVPEPTIRVPPSPMPSISMGHQATVDLDDLGADPDVSVEPADYLPSYGPGGVPPSQTLSIPSYTLSKSSSVTLSSEPSTSTSVPLPFALSDSLQDEVSLFDEFFLDGDIPSFEAALPSELTFDPSVATSESCPLSNSEDSAVPSSSAIPSYLLSLGTRVRSLGRASSASVCHASSGLVTSPPPVYIPTPRHLIFSSLQGATDVAGCPVSDPLAVSYVCDVSPQISRAAIFTTSTDALVTITIPAHPLQTSPTVSLASPVVSLASPHPSPVVSLAPPFPSSVASSVVSLASPHPSPVASLASPPPSAVASSVVSLASPHPSPVVSLASPHPSPAATLAPPLPFSVASPVVSFASPHPSSVASLASPLPSAVASPIVSLTCPHPSPVVSLAPPLPSSVASSVVSLASPHSSPVVSLASPHPSPVVSLASPHPSSAATLAPPLPFSVASSVVSLASPQPSPVVSLASPHPSVVSLASPLPSSVASPVVSFASPHPSDTSLASPHPSPIASLASPLPSVASPVVSFASPHPSDTSLASPHPSPVASLDSPYPSLAPTVESIAAPVVSLVSATPPLASSPFPGASGVPVSSVQPSSPVVSPISASLCPAPVAQSHVSDFLPLALVSPVISSGAQLPPQVITLKRELYRFARPDSTSRGTQTDAPESPGKDSSTQMIWKLE